MMSNEEALRLQELHRYKILFTEPEAAFDRVTALAKQLFGVPIVLISLVGEDLQWFKSCIGLNASSTSRDLSFCQHTMTKEGTFIVKDAILDDRFAHNELVTGAPGIRFYAGAPLTSPRGYGLGALCIIDTKAHPEGLTPDQQKTLLDLAGMVVSEMELRSANELLTSMKLELERSNEELVKFAQIVSHDLQTPVRTIGSFAQLLRKRLKGRLSEDEDQQFEFLSTATHWMADLVSGLLRFAQVGQEQMKVEDVSIEYVLASTLAHLKSAVEDNQAEILHTPLPVIRGDGLQISQLFQNLISNALKYRHPGRTPRILIDCNRQDGQWQFRIEDNGMGIAESNQGKIFEPLTRLHGSDISGSGMGLAICRSIVQRHGGEISVKSKLGAGTTFSIHLPVTPGFEGIGVLPEFLLSPGLEGTGA